MSVSYAVVEKRNDQPVAYVVRDEQGYFYSYDVASGLVSLVDDLFQSWPRGTETPADEQQHDFGLAAGK